MSTLVVVVTDTNGEREEECTKKDGDYLAWAVDHGALTIKRCWIDGEFSVASYAPRAWKKVYWKD